MPFARPNEAAIHVASDPYNHTSPWELYSLAHPIANLSVSDLPVSSLTVVPHALGLWDYNWYQRHRDHDARHGALWAPDIKSWERYCQGNPECMRGRRPMLVHCCGEDAPFRSNGMKKPEHYELKVRAAEKEYMHLTVNDVVSALGPYLHTIKKELLAAMGTADHIGGDGSPKPDDVKLVLYPGSLTWLHLEEGKGEGRDDFEGVWKMVEDWLKQKRAERKVWIPPKRIGLGLVVDAFIEQA
ncbi:hypothetical protein QBC35DRAFT_444566 [Podospora australis]|uniref:Uncharacterized protein n=1 Tax=Podospora australis TaxID=1536484 RepID=A0AAN6WIL6_9PEZI|nr:hypothetical protein QBC35DRAFT_444566 [Podospora australis]